MGLKDSEGSANTDDKNNEDEEDGIVFFTLYVLFNYGHNSKIEILHSFFGACRLGVYCR